MLPLEYARQSQDGRLTLVIVDEGVPVQTLWNLLDVTDVNGGIDALRRREGTSAKMIGKWMCDCEESRKSQIGSWASEKGLDAVVWTALPPKFAGVAHRKPSAVEACAYLVGLKGEERRLAEEYVRRTPEQVRTPYRVVFEEQLGWLSSPTA